METLLLAIVIILFASLVSLSLYRYPAAASAAGVSGIVIGCVIGLIPTVTALMYGAGGSLELPWSVPGGSFSVGLDPLSALFLLVIFVVSIPVCVYGTSYLWHHRSEHNPSPVWFFTGVLIASMAMVVVARNAVLFLVAWEVMSVSSFFLVTLDHNKRSVRRAGKIYFFAAHIGAAFVLAFFLMLAHQSGSLDFSSFVRSPEMSGILFLTALIGFGSKAGFMPLHVWLPEAHPVAPSHISALMSAVMIKMGVYGLLRSLTFLGVPSYWWGVVLIILGLTSGVVGVLYATTQSNIKRLLAYSSVENIGIIGIGIGVGVLGWSTNSPVIMAMGMGGALLHVINHSLFKGALFLASGSVLQRTGTLEIDRLGGLLKRMPRTAFVTLVASVSIVGLPIGNGFISEFLIYLGALDGAVSARTDLAAMSIVVVIGLALIGGLAAICFTKLVGIGFLGSPRTEAAGSATESDWGMTAPMLMLDGLCIVVGLGAFVIPGVLGGVVASFGGGAATMAVEAFQQSAKPMRILSIASGALMFLIVALAFVRLQTLRRRTVRASVTWDCGYAVPDTTMQYRGFSFVQITTGLFAGLLSIRKRSLLPAGPFPTKSFLVVKNSDGLLVKVYEPLFRGVAWILGRLRWLQHGNVHLYILYILITLLTLLFWKLR